MSDMHNLHIYASFDKINKNFENELIILERQREKSHIKQ